MLVLDSAALALVFAKASLAVIVSLSAGSIPRFAQPQINGAVLAFASALALLSTLLVGAVPSLHVSSIPFIESLQQGQRTGSLTRRGTNLRGVLVVSEVALTLLLLSGAGLMLRSFAELRKVDPGFRAENLLTSGRPPQRVTHSRKNFHKLHLHNPQMKPPDAHQDTRRHLPKLWASSLPV